MKPICCTALLIVAGCGSWTEVDVDVGLLELDTSGSTSAEMEFFTSDDVQTFKQQYGSQIGAVRRIDIRLQTMDPMASLQIGATQWAKTGERHSLDHDSQQTILDDVKAGSAVLLPVTVQVSPEGPVQFTLDAILVVQALDTL